MSWIERPEAVKADLFTQRTRISPLSFGERLGVRARSLRLCVNPIDEGCDPAPGGRLLLPPMKHLRFAAVSALLFTTLATSAGKGRECAPNGALKVECSAASAFITLDIQHCRRIGNITIELLDASGRVVYQEEGKALSNVLVRRLDKGAFPQGELTLRITSRDLRITQLVTVR